MSPRTGLVFASVTVAVAVEVETPSATIDAGETATLTAVAGPGVCVSVALPEAGGDVASLAVIVTWCAVFELVIVAVYVPSPLSVTGLIGLPLSVLVNWTL